MGLFDLFKKNEKNTIKINEIDENIKISEEEKKYYRPDSYYVDVVAEGTIFEHKVITFDQRKKTAIPSKQGLYPAEILLLEYCSKGDYPRPKNGYPAFWWFEYGIRDVGMALKSIEDRGFIAYAPIKHSLKQFTVPQLKELLIEKNQPITGKKADLILRVAEFVSDEELMLAGLQAKYVLTEQGLKELQENEYVVYMHNSPNKTTEDERFGKTFNVWSINKLLGAGDKSSWKTVVNEQEQK